MNKYQDYPIITAFIEDNIRTRIDSTSDQVIESYPEITTGRAWEIAGAYVLSWYQDEIFRLEVDESPGAAVLWDVATEREPTAARIIIDHSQNRGIMFDIGHILDGDLDFPLDQTDIERLRK